MRHSGSTRAIRTAWPGDAGRVAPLQYDYTQASGNWRHDRVSGEFIWARAIHRVAADGISPEQAVDEAIAASSRS